MSVFFFVFFFVFLSITYVNSKKKFSRCSLKKSYLVFVFELLLFFFDFQTSERFFFVILQTCISSRFVHSRRVKTRSMGDDLCPRDATASASWPSASLLTSSTAARKCRFPAFLSDIFFFLYLRLDAHSCLNVISLLFFLIISIFIKKWSANRIIGDHICTSSRKQVEGKNLQCRLKLLLWWCSKEQKDTQQLRST